MEIDVASYLDSAHGAKSRLRGAFRALLDSADHRHHLGARGPLPIVNFRYRGSRRLSEKTLNRLNESLVSEIQERGIAIPSLYALAGNPA
jgi:hypothetical protein